MASQDHGIHSFEECVPEGSDTFSRLWEEWTQEQALLLIREEKKLNMKLSWFKEDPSSDEEYKGLNS